MTYPTGRNFTKRIQRFCDEHLALAEANASEAARRAGYSRQRAGITAAELLRRADVAEYLTARRTPILRELADKHKLTLTRVVEEDACIAFSDIGDVIEQRGDNLYIKDIGAMKPEARCTIASATTSSDGTLRSIRRWDKGAALGRLGKLLQLLPPESPQELTLAERAERLAVILEAGMRRRESARGNNVTLRVSHTT